jgi:catechol 2,3-dioxygenase-like lactoylglutathione lyase family enzyme
LVGRIGTVASITGQLSPVLTVRDLAQSTAWYAEVFGMEIRRQFVDAEGRVGGSCLWDPSSGLELCLVDHDANPGAPFSEYCTGLDHLEFLVANRSDLDEWAEHLDSLGVEHSGVKQPEYTRNAMITFRDPDNIQLELFWRADEEPDRFPAS